MDARLQEKLEEWHEAVYAAAEAERMCLTLEASEKPLWGKLFLSVTGGNVAEKEAKVYSHDDWVALSRGAAEAKAEMNTARRLLDLKQSCFQAEYLSCKAEGEAVQRMPRGMT